MRRSLLFLVMLLSTGLQACSPTSPGQQSRTEANALPPEPVPAEAGLETMDAEQNPASAEQVSDLDSSPAGDPAEDLLLLWQDGPHLRGANIYQRRVYPELDGPDFLGPGPFGPPYTLEDLQQLASHGANYVNISHPGLFAETPPYDPDPAAQANLDQLLDWALEADLFVVIAFRTGPGRSEFTFLADGLGDWFDSSYLNDSVWTDAEAQEAWVNMWRYTASRYRGHPALAGYDLMVEPNANEVVLDEWDQAAYAAAVEGSLVNWNRFYPRIAGGIREVDGDTPILVEPVGYGSVDWLQVFEPAPVERMVVSVHQYRPFEYTHQSPWSKDYTFPGAFDTDWDGIPEVVEEDWFNTLLRPLEDFKERERVPMAVNEFGVQRWTPGASDFLAAEIAAFEARGLNYAVWLWEVSYPVYSQHVTAFQVRLGPDPDVTTEEAGSELLRVLEEAWERNELRPSDLRGQ